MSAYTTPNFNQNQAGEQYAAQRPTMPGYCFDYNTPFEEMRTPQDQIHWLYKHLRAAPQTDDYSNLQAQIDELKKMLEELLEQFEQILDELGNLKQMVNGMAEQSMTYDVTRGVYAPSIAVERRIWQAEAPFGMTVGEMAEYTVGEMAAYTCITVAKAGRHDIMEQPRREIIQDQMGVVTARYNPNDYIRRDELELIEVSNLQDHDIYGLPKSSLSTPIPKPAPLLRRGTVVDLKNLMINWQNHMLTKDGE